MISHYILFLVEHLLGQTGVNTAGNILKNGEEVITGGGIIILPTGLPGGGGAAGVGGAVAVITNGCHVAQQVFANLADITQADGIDADIIAGGLIDIIREKQCGLVNHIESIIINTVGQVFISNHSRILI